MMVSLIRLTVFYACVNFHVYFIELKFLRWYEVTYLPSNILITLPSKSRGSHYFKYQVILVQAIKTELFMAN